MVSRSPALTAIGFRRELAIFLSIVVGFLVVIVMVLIILLQMMSARYEQAVAYGRHTIANAALERLRMSGDDELSSSSLVYLRSTFGVDAIEVSRPGASPLASGDVADGMESVQRPFAGGTVTFWFDAAPVHATRRIFRGTVFVAFVATILTTVLLALFLPRIVRPFAEMLEKAREIGPQGAASEATYLVETFRRTIDTLKEQELELQRLHSAEKSRADELERIVSTLKRSLASGFLALDPSARVVEINDAGREILRVPRDLAVNESSLDTITNAPELADALTAAVLERRSILRDEISVLQGSREITVGLTLVPLIDDLNRYLGSIALFTDLTEIRVLERRLRETQTLADLGQIAAGIAHEFRNSLSTIRGYLKLALNQSNPAAGLARLEAADREAAELSNAIDRLLSFARPMEPIWEMVELRSIVDAVARRLEETGAGGNVMMEGVSQLEIQGDPTLLARAVENLLRNAIESNAMADPPGREVVVRFSRDPVPALEIRDDGIGLDPEDAARVILPFQSTKPGGWGLGLPLARRILILHGAEFDIRPLANRGAVVSARFDRNPIVTEEHHLTQKVSSSRGDQISSV